MNRLRAHVPTHGMAAAIVPFLFPLLALALLTWAPLIPTVQADPLVRAQLSESLPLIGADRVHGELGITGSGVGVLVIDDWRARENGQRHGKAVLEIVRATAPGARLTSCKLDLSRDVSLKITRCLRESLARDPGIRVVNLSFAVGDRSFATPCGHAQDPLANEIRRLSGAGLVFVAAAGNDGRNALRFPACLPEVISVGASYDFGGMVEFETERFSCRDRASPYRLACYSNAGPYLDLVAPGTVVSTPSAPDFGGTSAAAPLVSGVVALALEANGTLTLSELRDLLRGTGGTVFDTETREDYPRVNAYRAVQAALRRGSGGATSLRLLDTNENGVMDDRELYRAIDAWIGGRITDALFFQAIDSWVRRSPIGAAGPRRGGRESLAGMLDRAQAVRLFDLRGRRVAELRGVTVTRYKEQLNGLARSLANGVYFYVAVLPDGVKTGKIVLLE